MAHLVQEFQAYCFVFVERQVIEFLFSIVVYEKRKLHQATEKNCTFRKPPNPYIWDQIIRVWQDFERSKLLVESSHFIK